MAFPKTVAEHGPMIREDAIVVLRGRVDHRGDEVKFITHSIAEPDLSLDLSIRVRVPASRLSSSVVEHLKAVLGNHPGSSPVFIHMTSDDDEKVLRVGAEHNVEPRSALFAERRELLGHKAGV